MLILSGGKPSAWMIIDSSTHYVEHAAKTLFSMWVALTEHKWVTLGERRGLTSPGTGIFRAALVLTPLLASPQLFRRAAHGGNVRVALGHPAPARLADQKVLFDLFCLFAGKRPHRVSLERFFVEVAIGFRCHRQHLL